MLLPTLCLILASAGAETPETRSAEVLRLLLDHNYDGIYALFSPEMKQALPLDTFKAQSRQLEALGRPRAGVTTTTALGGNMVVTTPLEFSAVTLDFQVSFDAAGHLIGMFFRPHTAAAAEWQRPAYSKPDSFIERDITIGADDWKLPGTLTLPTGKGPFPAVVLVHGSGPNDRDETVASVKVFRDLAEGLASRGIAVLRYEKRTRVYGQRCAADAGFTMNEETVDDAVRAAALARTLPGIDARRVFVLGHSQGGYMMPRIVKRDPKLTGAIVLAGNVRPLEELMREQIEYLTGHPPASLPQLPAAYLADLKGYDPARETATQRVPMLILQGERDYQVTMKDFALWQAALGTRKDVTLRSFPALNHLFLAGEGRSTPKEYTKGGHVAEEAVNAIADWIGRAQ